MIADGRLAHVRDLEQCALAAFAVQDWAACFRFIDRRCRLRPPVGPDALQLRAEASLHLGLPAAALADWRAARELDPRHVSTLLALVRHSPEPDERAAAALTLIDAASDSAVLREALSALAPGKKQAVGSLRRAGEVVQGWVAWRGTAPRLSVETPARGNERAGAGVTLRAQAGHPLAVSPWQACTVVVPAPDAGGRVTIRAGTRVVASLDIPPPPSSVSCGAGCSPPDAAMTVIVPVYGDAPATVACLRSLLDDAGLGDHRLILVDDASPDPAITALFDERRGDERVTILRNAVNRGFAASINRALATLEVVGDVVLLNADTLVPPGALDRLRRAGRAEPGIGTVTPFSNNGEFTSLPQRFVVNPLPSPDEVRALDEAAASANAGVLVDLPSGVGFCLLITAPCLAAVGALSERYARGYLEDVDYCLRAREKRFRNVCATDVFVGHAGSRSFADAKRALVLANERRLAARFPEHGRETAVFVGADPLQGARARIEAALPPARPGGILLAGAAAPPLRHGTTRLRSALEMAAATLAQHDQPGLALRVGARSGRPAAALYGLGGARPQNVSFNTADADEADALRTILAAQAPVCVTLYETAALSDALFENLAALDVPMDLVVSDAGPLCPRGTLRQPDGHACAHPHGDELCRGCAVELVSRSEVVRDRAGRGINGEPARYRPVWRERMKRLDTVFADGQGTAAFVQRYLPELASKLEANAAAQPVASSRPDRELVLGAVVREPNAVSDAVLQALARATGRHEGQALIVVGQPLDDRALLGARDTWVTGAIRDAEDFARVIAGYGIGALVLADPCARFGHEADGLAQASGLPLAFFDWAGAGPSRVGDLALDPRAPFAEAAALAHRWHASLHGHHPA